MVRYRCRVMLATMLPSHAGDGTTEATWPWCNVDAVMLATMLPSHADDNVVESCWRRHCRDDLAAT
jgi:hypothetical protein